jgi:hypothetical protein
MEWEERKDEGKKGKGQGRRHQGSEGHDIIFLRVIRKI